MRFRRPPMCRIARWLTAFPSFGFVLSVRREHVERGAGALSPRANSHVRLIGTVDASREVIVTRRRRGRRAVELSARNRSYVRDRTHDGGSDMPVMHFRIRWPDGVEANCYSPSTVVGEFFAPGDELCRSTISSRARARRWASARNACAQKYGFACSAAMDQLARIEEDAETVQRGAPHARVTGASTLD